MISLNNFIKWLAFSFPYLASILSSIIVYAFDEVLNIHLNDDNILTLTILLNSLSILFGISILSNYNHKNDFPNNYLDEKNQLKK
jgi:hypothetical protein